VSHYKSLSVYLIWSVGTKISFSWYKVNQFELKLNDQYNQISISTKNRLLRIKKKIYNKSWSIRQKVGQFEQHLGLSVQVGQLIPQLSQTRN